MFHLHALVDYVVAHMFHSGLPPPPITQATQLRGFRWELVAIPLGLVQLVGISLQ